MTCDRFRLWASCCSLVGLSVVNMAAADQLAVSADTWVREDSSASNRDGDGFMNARTDSDADDNDVVLLQFDVSSIAGPSAGVSLNLTWYRSDGSTGKNLSLYGINDLAADDSFWDETTVTYDSAPGLIPDGLDPPTEIGLGHDDDDVHDLDISNLTPLVLNQDYGPQVEGDLYTFSSAVLDTFLNADTNGLVTFLITRNTDPSSNQARFTQKEAAAFNSGALVPPGGAGAYLDNVTVPEPGTAGMLFLAATMLIRPWRRRD